jgi:glutathione S-transferase kappa 1
MSGKKVLVDFFYDVISPYSWFGLEAITRHAAVWPDVQLKLRPFFLGTIMAETKNKPPILVKAKIKYLWTDVERLKRFHGVPLTVPAAFKDYVFLVEEQRQQMLFVSAVDLVTSGKQTENVSRECYKAIFTDHIEVGKLPFRELAIKAGVSAEDADKCMASMQSKQVEDHLNKNCTDALSFGAFGAPTTVAHLPAGPAMFFGSDRMELLAHTLGQKYHGALLCKNKL